MPQASWGEMTWEIANHAAQLFVSLDLAHQLKQEKNKDRDGQNSNATKGVTQDDFSVEWTITPLAGVDVWDTFSRWKKLIGSIATFRVGEAVTIENAQLARVALSNTVIDARGRFLSAQISTKFQINDPEQRKRKASNPFKINFTPSDTGAAMARLGTSPTTGVNIGPSAKDKAGKRGT